MEAKLSLKGFILHVNFQFQTQNVDVEFLNTQNLMISIGQNTSAEKLGIKICKTKSKTIFLKIFGCETMICSMRRPELEDT